MKKLVGRYNEIQLLEEFAVSQTPQFQGGDVLSLRCMAHDDNTL